ncbi:MAG: ABC transporter ATP-binding protein [Bifidobacteriaceae bacterium]|jgi:ABC-2 type transport system ATP-binding protein|nr:ABC transporter ATP-binding protein [Bifidobacteriaceae bacterium]
MRYEAELRGATKRYGGVTAISGACLAVAPGSVVGLLGPNGAGKTTCLELLAGLKRPTSGEVRVFGVDPQADRAAIRSQVGFQPQHCQLLENQTVGELFGLWTALYGVGGADQMIARLGLEDARRARLKRLSAGTKRRVLLGLTFLPQPRLALLEEPTSLLDPAARDAVWDLVADCRSRGGTVIVSTHRPEVAEQLCDAVAILDGGRIVAQGAPVDLIGRHCPGRALEALVEGPLPPGWAGGIVGAVSAFGSPRRGRTLARVVTAEPEAALAQLRRLARVVESRPTPAGLPDVYAQVTRPLERVGGPL